jgi:hypothetical protein
MLRKRQEIHSVIQHTITSAFKWKIGGFWSAEITLREGRSLVENVSQSAIVFVPIIRVGRLEVSGRWRSRYVWSGSVHLLLSFWRQNTSG